SSAKPLLPLTDLDQIRLAQNGVNVLRFPRAPLRPPLGLRTLLPEPRAKSEGRYLSARRFTLFLTASIEHGTRWAVLERPGPALWARARAQVIEFFRALEDEGAFVGSRSEDNYFVVCDQRINAAPYQARVGLRLL